MIFLSAEGSEVQEDSSLSELGDQLVLYLYSKLILMCYQFSVQFILLFVFHIVLETYETKSFDLHQHFLFH